jgi:hypothetical protein
MEIKDTTYAINYDAASNTVQWRGSLRLGSLDEYAPIMDLMEQASVKDEGTLTLDLRELAFLNSSGINVLSKFIIKLRKHSVLQVVIHGSQKIPWQTKSLKNLQRLMANLQLEWDS